MIKILYNDKKIGILYSLLIYNKFFYKNFVYMEDWNQIQSLLNFH